MNIFLDANVIYKDPLFKNVKNKILLMLAKHDDVKIYMSKAVYSEVLRAHKVYLEEGLKTIQIAQGKLVPYLNKPRDTFDINISIDKLVDDFESYLEELQSEEQLVIIDYNSKVLERVVELDMFEKSPFIKKKVSTNKETIVKKEIRDAIIWFSYEEYILENNLGNCYFISNNTKEFADSSIYDKSKVTQPYPLHPNLQEKVEIIAYKSVHDFLTHKNDTVQELFKDEKLHAIILTTDLFKTIESELSTGYLEDLVKQNFAEDIFETARSYLTKLEPSDIHEDYHMIGYVDTNFDLGEIENIRLLNMESYGDSIAVMAEASIELDVEIYMYNPVYDTKDEKYSYFGQDVIKLKQLIEFIIPITPDKGLDIENFSLSTYLNGEEEYLETDIQIVELKNIHHVDLYPDEYED